MAEGVEVPPHFFGPSPARGLPKRSVPNGSARLGGGEERGISRVGTRRAARAACGGAGTDRTQLIPAYNPWLLLQLRSNLNVDVIHVAGVFRLFLYVSKRSTE